jgi:hypothetical protein
MTIVRALDANGDWLYGKGLNDYLTGNAAIAQSINTRLNSVLGDCFFDTGSGIDWFNLLGSSNSLALELAISSTILNTANVTGMIQLSVVINETTRNIMITYQVSTIYSTISNQFQYNVNAIT